MNRAREHMCSVQASQADEVVYVGGRKCPPSPCRKGMDAGAPLLADDVAIAILE